MVVPGPGGGWVLVSNGCRVSVQGDAKVVVEMDSGLHGNENVHNDTELYTEKWLK